MSWNYRIVKYGESGAGFGLHEVFYDKNGKPEMMSMEPAGFVCMPDEDPKKSIVVAISMALAAAKEHPVLDEDDIRS